jgi:hypothetical protein
VLLSTKFWNTRSGLASIAVPELSQRKLGTQMMQLGHADDDVGAGEVKWKEILGSGCSVMTAFA